MASNVDHFVVLVKVAGYYVLLTAGPLFLSRGLGMQLVRDDVVCDGVDWWRFSLRDLFSWITATAITLGIAKYFVPSDYLKSLAEFGWLLDDRFWLEAATILLPCIVVTLASCWLVLGHGGSLLADSRLSWETRRKLWGLSRLRIVDRLLCVTLVGLAIAGLWYKLVTSSPWPSFSWNPVP